MSALPEIETYETEIATEPPLLPVDEPRNALEAMIFIIGLPSCLAAVLLASVVLWVGGPQGIVNALVVLGTWLSGMAVLWLASYAE